MTHPRRIEPGATYLITRRINRRHMLLRPDEATRDLVLYVLAVAATRHSIHVHAFCAMSTHIHLVVTDPEGTLPRFLQCFHRCIALPLKVMRKWEGTVWDAEKTSVVRLESPDAFVEKVAYVIANPVAAGLVEHAEQWPGARSIPTDLDGGVYRAPLPEAWFDPRSRAWPEEAELRLAAPPEHIGDVEAVVERITGAVDRMRITATHALRLAQRRFVGVRVVRRLSPYRRAIGREPLRSLSPTFATGPRQRSLGFDAALRLREFRRAYRIALARWSSGDREAEFPPGTWWMRVAFGARTAEPR